MKKRIITFAMTLALLLSLVPVIQPQAEAEPSMTVMHVSDVTNLMKFLSTGYYYVTLDKDIDATVSGVSPWCTIAGKAVLNLNGHDLIIHDEDRNFATMFCIEAGAQLVVSDTKGGGSIQFRADINSNGDLVYRNLFDVYGLLTINGGSIEAGRSVSNYSAYYAKTVYRQTYGTAVTVRSGGKAIVNGGTILGRGHGQSVFAMQGGSLLLNNGAFKAKGGADILSGSNTNLTYAQVKAGTFSCETLGAVKMFGRTSKGYPKGTTQIPDYAISFNRVSVKGDGTTAANSSELRVTPNDLQPGHDLTCGGTNDGGLMKITAATPIISSQYTEKNCYWITGDPDRANYSYLDDGHSIAYTWALAKDGTILDTVTISEPGIYTGTFQNSVNVMKDFKVTPVKGETYQIACVATETLGDYEVLSIAKAYYFTVVDDLKAPTITVQPPAALPFEKGQDVTLTITATGTNLNYSWEVSTDNGTTWETAFPGFRNPTINTIPMNSTTKYMYRCKVSNSAGTVTSTPCTVYRKDTTVQVDRVDIIANWNSDCSAIASFSTTTPGCTVTKVQYAMFNKALDSVQPGDNIELAFGVELDKGYAFSSSCKAVLNGSQDSTFRISGSPVRFVFELTVPYPEGGLPIQSTFVQLNDPVIGQPLGDVNMGSSGGAKSKFDRSGKVESYQWYCNGQPVSADTVAQAGAAYTVQATLKSSSEHYHYTPGTSVTMGDNSPNILSIFDDGQRMTIECAFPPLEAGDTSGDPLADPSADPGTDPGAGDDYVFPFVDVLESDWFYSWVKSAHQMGLVEGTSATTFSPSGNMSYAQAITLAARMHQKYTTGAVTLVNGTDKWYDTYVQYCWDNGIIDTDYSAVMNAPIDRQSYAYIFSMALPKEALKEKNTIPNGSIPDVQASNPNYTAIYQLYRAGILNGSDAKGTFNPTNFIKRSEVSAIVVRMMDETVRVGAPAELGM